MSKPWSPAESGRLPQVRRCVSDTARCVEAHMPIDGIDLPAESLGRCMHRSRWPSRAGPTTAPPYPGGRTTTIQCRHDGLASWVLIGRLAEAKRTPREGRGLLPDSSRARPSMTGRITARPGRAPRSRRCAHQHPDEVQAHAAAGHDRPHDLVAGEQHRAAQHHRQRTRRGHPRRCRPSGPPSRPRPHSPGRAAASAPVIAAHAPARGVPARV